VWCAGPLTAVVEAQAKAALHTVEFISKVGFDNSSNLVTVDFYYNTVNATTGSRIENVIQVPLLTIMPIPFLQVRDHSEPYRLRCDVPDCLFFDDRSTR
jgi:hypothetical protein